VPNDDDIPELIHGRTWEQMPVGFAFRTSSRTITETDLVTFVSLTGATEPLFGDRGVVTTRNTVYNQHGDEVMIYQPVRLTKGATQ
jgi:acyl dehydratase